MKLLRISQILVLTAALAFVGCGGKTSDSGFPFQQPITPTTGTLNGRIDIPTNTSDQNLNSSISRIRAAVNRFENLSVKGIYVDSLGITQEVTGRIAIEAGNTGATYVIETLPFNTEITVVVTRGKITLKAVSPPLSPAEDTRTKTIDPESTAEAILFEEIKRTNPSVSFELQSQSPDFLREKQVIAVMIRQEMANENIDSNSTDLLSRPFIVSQVESTADAVVNQQVINHLPYTVIDSLGSDLSSAITVVFRLFDPENNSAMARVFYSLDGSTFLPATLGNTGINSGTVLAAESGDGISHSFVWESAADLAVGTRMNVVLAVDVTPVGLVPDTSNTNRTLTVEFEVDNRGIPAILSLSSSEHLLGQESIINVQGLNLNIVNRVDLEYLGVEPFIDPKVFSIQQFLTSNDQTLSLTIPAYGPFPVSYRLALSGARPQDRVLSTQEIIIKELNSPDFTLINPGLNPSQGFNHLTREIRFEGKNLMGIFEDRAVLQKLSDPSIRIELAPESASLMDSTGLMEWRGVVPTRLLTGAYQIRVRNTCDPSTPCGNEVEVATNNTGSVVYTVLETFPIIDSILPSFGGVAFNSQDHEVDVIGERLSSVSEVRLSTNRDLLNSNFSNQFQVSITDTSYTSLTFIFPVGANPGTYFVGVKNAFGKAVSSETFLAKEGVIPSTSVQALLLDPALNPLGSVQVSNLQSFILDLSGNSLTSLHTVRLINRDLSGVVIDLPPNFTSFNQAQVPIPEHLPPGRYRLDLENSAGLTSVNCDGFSCFEITEAAPVITDFSNELKPQDLSKYQIIAGEAGILSIQGSNLAGVRSAAICRDFVTCDYPISSVSGSFEEVIANLTSSVYMKPGTYFLQVTNQTASAFSPTQAKLEVLERTPELEFIQPNTLSSAQLLNDVNIITFTGQNLFGVSDIYFLPSSNASNPCTIPTTQTPFHFLGTEIEGISRTQATLTLQNLGTLLPGTYAVRMENLTPSGTSNLSFCNQTTHKFTVTEPPLEFLNFFGSSPANPTSTTVFTHTSNEVTFVGKFLFGLDQVQLQRRGPEIQNLPSVYEAEITTSFLSQASFRVRSGLLPGTYDLLMRNSGMSEPALVGASVEISEIITPVINEILVLGENQENTDDIFIDLKGEALDGVGLFTHSITLIDTRDTAHLIPLPTTQLGGLIELRALPDQSTFVRAKIPRSTPGGNYLVSVMNSSGQTSPETSTAVIDVFEPKAVFESLNVLGPFDEEFGFGENTRKTRLELKGDNLASSARIFLQREPGYPGDSSETLFLESDVIHRIFQSQEISVKTTLPLFLRPGFYDVEIKNNSGSFSDRINPISSPFFQQVQVREGAPKLELVGCLDFELIELVNPSSVNSECSTSFTTRNVKALNKHLKFTARNIYTLEKVAIFPEGSLVPELSYDLPFFRQSLQGTGVLTHTSRTVEVELPEVLKTIGFYDIELTNGVGTVRFGKKLKSAELFPATIFTMNPNSVLNNFNTTVIVSGDHLTGTTQIGLFTSDFPSSGATLITTLPFERDPNIPLNQLRYSVPENLFPSTYRIEILNTKGFNSGNPVNDLNMLTISEPAPLITTLSALFKTNETTQTILVSGDGFLGLDSVVFQPSTVGAAGTSNSNMSIPHSVIPLEYSVTSRSLMSVKIPPLQLPGFYQLSLENTHPSSYLHEVAFQIRENPPAIFSIDPAFVFYAEDEQIIVTGTAFLGVRGTPVSSTYARLTHTDSGVHRDLFLDQDPTYDTLHLTVPKNLLIGQYEMEIRNQVGVASSVTVTQFFVREGVVQIQAVTGTVFQYDDDFTDPSKRVDIFGKHLQGVKRIQITTQIQGRTYTYDLIDGVSDPYISITNSIINTDFVYPGQYQLLIENTAGVINPATPVIDIEIPPSVITDLTPQVGPFNSPTEIIITGNHLRRWERLEFQRATSGCDIDDSVNILHIATNTNPAVFEEISHTQTRVIFGSQNNDERFSNSCGINFDLCYKTYGDPAQNPQQAVSCYQNLVLPTVPDFKLVGNIPEIDSFEDENGVPISTTTTFTDFPLIGQAVPTALISDDLPLDLVIVGANYDSLQEIKIIRDSDSVEWTLACTSGTGSASLNQGSLTTVSIRIPREIFQFPANPGANSCPNPQISATLPLKPGLYSFVVSGTSGSSSPLPKRVKFYFAEGFPNGLSLSGIQGTTLFNDVDHQFSLEGSELLGARTIRIKDQAEARLSDFSVDQFDTETKIKFTVPKGTLRGLKNSSFSDYSVQVLNSRGWTQTGTEQLNMKERAPHLDSILPVSGQNLATSPVIFEGNHLLGVGQPLIGQAFNRLRMIHKESAQDPLITTFSVDLTPSVTVQSLTSFVAVVPQRLLPGEYFFSVENDHFLTAFNPRVFENIIFEALDSSPVVTFVTPVVSDFDLLPPVLQIQGLHLSGIRTAELNLVGAPVSNRVSLSLISSPDITSAFFDSVEFHLPQSPSFLIPGRYEISIENTGGKFKLANFHLDILEKVPRLDEIIPVQPASFDNSGLVTFDLEGDNLFGHPVISVSRNSTTKIIHVTGALQSRFAIRGLTLVDSLFPDIWLLSFENSQGSTSLSFIVTEPVPQIEFIDPDRVPFDSRTFVQLTGDHFIGASTAPGSLTLTDVLKTPLEEIKIINRRTMEAVVPKGIQVGRYQIMATNKAGRNTTSAILTVQGSGLSLDSITPNTGSVSGGEFLTIGGFGFVQGTRLVIGNSLAQDILVQPTKLEAFAPALSASIPITGASTAVRVQLVNPDGEIVGQEAFYTYFKEPENAPKLTKLFPGAISGGGPTGKPINTRIAFEFNQPMDAQTLSDIVSGTANLHGVEVLSNRNVIGGTLTWDADSRIFVYNSLGINFIPNEPVDIGFSSSIRSQGGDPLFTSDVIQLNSPFFDDPYIEDWAFETGGSVDNSSLSVVAPISSGSSAPETWETDVIFSKELDPLTLNAEDIFLTENLTGKRIFVEIQLGNAGLVVHINPQERLNPNRAYTLRWKKTNLKSLTQHSMSSDFVYNIGSQATGPKLLSIVPSNEETGVPRNGTVVFEFDQSVSEESVNESNIFVLAPNSQKVSGVFTHNEERTFYTLKFLELLEGGETYEVFVSNRVKSPTGVPITQEATSAFEVSILDEVDLDGPVIVDVFPANLSSRISTEAMAVVTFNESIHKADVTTSNFEMRKVTDGGFELIAYEVSLQPDRSSVILTPLNRLEHEGTYSVLAKSGIHDLASNQSTEGVSVSFTVTPHFDSIGPNIVDVIPSDGAVQVAISTHVQIQFSEPIEPNDVTAQNFVLQTEGGAAVPGGLNLEQNGTLVRLIPSEPLLKETSYVMEVSGTIRDVFSNSRGVDSTFSFSTESFFDNVAPIITNLTINQIPSTLNGDGTAVFDNLNAAVIPELHVAENGFTIDIYYEDPGLGGETSGVDQSTITIIDEKQVHKQIDANNQQLITNLNLLQQGVFPIHREGHTQLIIPSNWIFAPGRHILTATVKDQSVNGNISDPKVFEFQVDPVVGEEINYPFENGKITTFSLDYDSDHFLYDASVQLGNLRMRTLFEPDGAIDFQQELEILGFISDDTIRPPNLTASPSASVIGANITTFLQSLVLKEIRQFFDLDPDSGQPNIAELPVGVRFENQLPGTQTGITRILIGGDNGAETGGGVGVVKSTERSFYNTANRSPFLSLISRSELVDEGLGVFSTQIIRRFANEPESFQDWQSRFTPVSLFAYTNTGGINGLPIGYYPQDENVYLVELDQVNTIPEEIHRTRYLQMRFALESYARILAVSVAKVAGVAVGLVPKGIPPLGLYGGSQNIPEFFEAQQSVFPYLRPIGENNLMRSNIDLVDIFAPAPGDLKLSNFSSIYLRNQIRVTQ